MPSTTQPRPGLFPLLPRLRGGFAAPRGRGSGWANESQLERGVHAQFRRQFGQFGAQAWIQRDALDGSSLLRVVFDFARDIDALGAGSSGAGMDQLDELLHAPTKLLAWQERIDPQCAAGMGH